MGIDILYFMDHDLPMNDFRQLCTEFKKRVRGNAVVLDDADGSETNMPTNGMWHIVRYCYSENDVDINLSYNDSLSLLFIDRKDDETWRDQDVCSSEAKYLFRTGLL